MGYLICGVGTAFATGIKNRKEFNKFSEVINKEFGGGLKGDIAEFVGNIITLGVITITWPSCLATNIYDICSGKDKKDE